MRRAIHIAVASVMLGAAFPVCLGQDEAGPPLFEGMGTHGRRVGTSDRMAQRYFDQGLVWMYAFNHDEAIRSFKEAARRDPDLAMAWWGVALCNGPHINNPAMDEARSRAAWEALEKARALAGGAAAKERALIEALGSRYADPDAGKLPLTFEERAPLDRAYAEAMKRVHERHKDDPDIATFYAESLMDLRPWDLWDKEGRPRPETPAVLEALEGVLAAHPGHPGANHLYIHAVEASPEPGRAVRAADVLRTLVPGSGHLVHMPAHIDVRTGRWQSAADQNVEAIEVDRKYREISPKQGFYRIYMAHNHHFLSYACMMEGRSEDAIKAARAMIAGIPPEFISNQGALIDGYTPIAIEAMMRFGKWDEILKEPRPPAELPITTAMWRYARAAALAAQGKLDEAREEQGEFKKAVAAVPEGAVMAINPAEKVLSIAEHALAGEIAFRSGKIDEAVKELTAAAEIEDTLQYMEPPDWVQPVRHTLGAVLVSAKRFDDAEKVYRADLAWWPENGWSLFGLAQCMQAKGSPEAAELKERFKKAWSRADTEIESTCLCVPGDG